MNWTEKLLEAARRFNEIGQRPGLRRAALFAAIATFAIGLVVSIRQLPEGLGILGPRFLALVALVGVPTAIALNAVETRLAATLVGASFAWSQSLRIGLLSSAANMLPLPGGALVRVAALKGAGASLLRSSVTTTLTAAIWLGLALLYAGLLVLPANPMAASLLLTFGTIATVAFCAALFRACRSMKLVAIVIFVRSAAIGVGVLRMYWVLIALGVAVTYRDVGLFAVADVAGSAVSIVPAGLGISEAIAAALAPLIQVPAAAAFLAVGLNRVIALPVLIVATAATGALRDKSSDVPATGRS